MDWLKPSRITRLVGTLLSTTASLTAAHAEGFGKIVAVNQEATGTPPGGATRVLRVGTDIAIRERVRTSASGSAQLLFPDQSALNLGANCDLVINEFAYNPQGRTGSMVASATKGVLRYVGGQISHNSGVTIKTPAGTLGVRGGIVTVMLPLPASIAKLDPALAGLSGVLIISHFGQTTVTNSTGSVVLQPGFATVINSSGQPIPVPFRLSDAVLTQVMQLINSKQGQTGGVASGSGPTNGGLPAGFGFTFVQNPSNPPGADPLGYTSVFGAGNSASSGVSQGSQAAGTTPPSAPPPPPPSPPPYH